MKAFLKRLKCRHEWTMCWWGDYRHKGIHLAVYKVQHCQKCGKVKFTKEKIKNPKPMLSVVKGESGDAKN